MSSSSYRHILTSLLLCLVSSTLLVSSTPPPSPPSQDVLAPPRSALLIVDMQNCFSPTGALPVPSYLSLLPVINHLHTLPLFSLVALSQDYHPSNHISFAETWPDAEPFTSRQLHYHSTTGHLCNTTHSPTPPTVPALPCHTHTPITPINQTLWPQHCVAGNDDSAFHPHLLHLPSDIIVRKGHQPHIDSYSAFQNALSQRSQLPTLLRDRGVGRLYVVGVAMDVCVAETVMDGVAEGLEVVVVEDGVAGIDAEAMAEKKALMAAAGVQFVHSWEVPGWSDAAVEAVPEKTLDVEVVVQ